MINLYSKPLPMIFKDFIDTGTFPGIWNRVIPEYCHNNTNTHNICLLETLLIKLDTNNNK